MAGEGTSTKQKDWGSMVRGVCGLLFLYDKKTAKTIRFKKEEIIEMGHGHEISKGKV